jgi:hypothetical protein
MTPRLQLIAGVVLVAGALGLTVLHTSSPAPVGTLQVLVVMTLLLGGVLSFVRAIRASPQAPLEEPPAPPPPTIEAQPLVERAWTPLEVLRWVAMIASALCAVIAATWFRFALYDNDPWWQFGAVEASAIVTFVVAAVLFVRAYAAGTTPRELPEDHDLWDRMVGWIEDHGAILAMLALTVSSGVMFAGVFSGESIGDDLTFHFAESRRLADCIAAGDWDLWNPSANGGYASAYYYQVIPQLASAVPTALFGHHLFWFQLSLWLPLVIVPPAAYRGMRLLGASPWQSVAAAFAVTFISGASRWGSGADGTFQVGLYTQTWALAFFPLGLGHGVKYLTEGKHLPSAIGWGTLVFLCHPFASIALCLGLAVGTLAHYLQFRVRDVLIQRVLLAILTVALAAVLYKLLTDRPLPPESAPDTPVAPIKYIYLAPLILVVGLIARVAASGRLLAGLLMIGTILAFGANLVAYTLVQIVPKREEGALVDPPATWDFGAAASYLGPLLVIYAIGARLWIAARPLDGLVRGIAAACLLSLTAVTVLIGAMRGEVKIVMLVILPLAAGIRLAWPDRAIPPPATPPEVTPSRSREVLGAVAMLAFAGALGLAGLITKQLWIVGLAISPIAGFCYLGWRNREEPLIRLVIVGACLAVATMPGWLTVIVDRDGFGGFPHRVWDEVGPGYVELGKWHSRGMILDHNRIAILTWCLPLVLVFAHMRFGRWLWTPGLVFAALLALGPHAPKTADDLLPAVRFLGAMQVVLAMAIGAGMFAIGRALWNARLDHPVLRFARLIAGQRRPVGDVVYGVRTVLIALACALTIFVGLMGSRVLSQRVSSLDAFDYHGEMFEMIALIEKQPAGKKQVGPGCENHWWNMLSYVYARRPSLLQMGGGGLQASPNYDFVYSVREFPKLAWVYDTPLFLFAKASGGAPDGEKLGETARYELRRLPAPGIVSPIQITGVLPEGESRAGSPVRVAAIDWLKSSDPLSDHHLAYFGHGGLFQAPDAKVLRAFRVDPSPGELADIYAEVEVKQPTTFVARESWHPRWHAYVDGVEVPIRRVTPDFPAIDVGPGKHTLAFRFERPWWAHVSWLAWPGITLGAWWLLRRLRRKTALPRAELIDR